VVVGVDVQPGALVAEAVGHPHAEHVAVEGDHAVQVAVSELTWPSLRGWKPPSVVVDRAMGGRGSSAGGRAELDAVAVGVAQVDGAVLDAVLDAEPSRWAAASSSAMPRASS
jgi:hypothetical protein